MHIRIGVLGKKMAAKSLMRENFSDDAKESVVPAESFLEEIKRYLAENESINFD